MSAPQPPTGPRQVQRPPKIDKPTRTVTYEEWAAAVKATHPTRFRYIRLAAALVCQLRSTTIDLCGGVVFVGPPSAGKTTVIELITGDPALFHTSDKPTAASLVSNASNVKPSLLPKIDLLPKIRHKAFVIMDLAPVFSGSVEQMNAFGAQLTRALDGKGLQTDSATHGHRGYTGDYTFVFLGATTPPPQRAYDLLQRIGPRLFFLQVRDELPCQEKLVLAMKNSGVRLHNQLKELTRQLFANIWWNKPPQAYAWDKEQDPDELLEWLAKASSIVRLGRAGRSGGEDDESLQPEYPYRVAQYLHNFAIGSAILHQRHHLTMEDVLLAVDLAVEAPTPPINHVLRAALANGGSATTAQVAEIRGCTLPTARESIRITVAAGIGRESTEAAGPGSPSAVFHLADTAFAWLLSPELADLRWKPGQPAD